MESENTVPQDASPVRRFGALSLDIVVVAIPVALSHVMLQKQSGIQVDPFFLFWSIYVIFTIGSICVSGRGTFGDNLLSLSFENMQNQPLSRLQLILRSITNSLIIGLPVLNQDNSSMFWTTLVVALGWGLSIFSTSRKDRLHLGLIDLLYKSKVVMNKRKDVKPS